MKNNLKLPNIQINFKDVCYTCRHRDTYLDENNLYKGCQVLTVLTVIGCKHEKVCSCYLENE